MEEIEESKELLIHRRISMLVTILLILTVLLCLHVAIGVLSDGYVNIGGFMMFRVVTGSMEPTISTGALMITQQVDITSIQLQDIVCFRTREQAIWGKIVTHRVVGIQNDWDGAPLLETKGDANLVADGFLVDQSNFIGKVIWHTGDDSMLADILSLFTNKIGFLGFIVLPALLLAGIILKDSVINIRQDLRRVLEESGDQAQSWQDDPLCGMTQEEYNEMYQRIRAELMEELKYFVELQAGQGLAQESPSEKSES